jgi:rhodanese-related sulfurtransferase
MVAKIERDELKSKMDRGEDFVLIEVLTPRVYERGHIKGAINIPFKRIAVEARKRFDQNKELVVYCSDSACKASQIAAQKLDKLGFSAVQHYQGGKKDWEEAGYPMEFL